MMSLTFGLFTQVSGSGPLGPLVFSFASHLRGQLVKEFASKEQILSYKSRPYFERAALSRKANRKSQKLFPFAKMAEKERCTHTLQTTEIRFLSYMYMY